MGEQDGAHYSVTHHKAHDADVAEEEGYQRPAPVGDPLAPQLSSPFPSPAATAAITSMLPATAGRGAGRSVRLHRWRRRLSSRRHTEWITSRTDSRTSRSRIAEHSRDFAAGMFYRAILPRNVYTRDLCGRFDSLRRTAKCLTGVIAKSPQEFTSSRLENRSRRIDFGYAWTCGWTSGEISLADLSVEWKIRRYSLAANPAGIELSLFPTRRLPITIVARYDRSL